MAKLGFPVTALVYFCLCSLQCKLHVRISLTVFWYRPIRRQCLVHLSKYCHFTCIRPTSLPRAVPRSALHLLKQKNFQDARTKYHLAIVAPKYQKMLRRNFIQCRLRCAFAFVITLHASHFNTLIWSINIKPALYKFARSMCRPFYMHVGKCHRELSIDRRLVFREVSLRKQGPADRKHSPSVSWLLIYYVFVYPA